MLHFPLNDSLEGLSLCGFAVILPSPAKHHLMLSFFEALDTVLLACLPTPLTQTPCPHRALASTDHMAWPSVQLVIFVMSSKEMHLGIDSTI